MTRYKLIFSLLVVAIACGCGKKRSDAVPQNDSAPRSENSGVSGPLGGTEIVQADVQRVLKAVYANDIDTLLAFTHPMIIQQMGGPSQAKSVLQKTLGQLQSVGMTMESLTFPEKPTFAQSGARCFAVVPTKLIIASKGQRLESLNYQLGVREAGATNWTYIEGSRVNRDNIKALFPDYPSNLV